MRFDFTSQVWRLEPMPLTNKKNWKVYWNRADLKWHSYKPVPEVASLEEFLALVERDEHACFFG